MEEQPTLVDKRNQLQKELDESTESLTRLSAKCKILAAQIRKLDKAIEKNRELIENLDQ
jgi:hypothetical protein